MKKDNKNGGNEPFYSKFKKPEIGKTSEKTEKAPSKKWPDARGGKNFDKPFDREKRNFDKPFEKRDDRPKRSEKPDFKKSYDKPFEKKADFKPQGEKSIGKPFERRNDRPERGDKPAFKKSFDKPFDREKRNFDKPYEKRDDRPRGEREGDKPAFKKSFDKPFDREKRNFDKPFEKREERSGDKPAFKKSFDKPFDREKRNFDKPYEKRDERPRRERDDRPTFDKPFDREKRPRSTDKSDEREKRTRTEDGERRRVGEFTEAPRYDFRQAEERYTKRAKNEPVKSGDERIRLNKYIANAGLCSRREADELIETGQITVNGKVVTEMGYRVNPGEVVKYGTRVLNPEKMVYILVNKPKDYITTTDDPEGRHTVMELIAGACKERVYPVGRLDRNTTGLLLLTNDGELAEKLMHPSNEIHKVYQVEIQKPITNEDFEKIKEGLELEDGFIKPDDVAIVTPDAMVVGIEIHSGRNRIVRRIFESLGYEVLKLDRTVYGGLTKKELPRGKWRFLNEKEVVKLKYLT